MSESARRAALVEEAGRIIDQGSQSFRSASRLFDPAVRERSWLLYAWCRACDDLTDGQRLGHDARTPANPKERQRRIEDLTGRALAGETTGVAAFDALGLVQRECRIPRGFVEDHLEGFALDADHWSPRSEADMLRYCYHVAGAVGVMMAVIMGVDPDDRATLDRASDLGIAFQLNNIARDLVPDAASGRAYVPRDWREGEGISDLAAFADPRSQPASARLAKRLVELARRYRASSRVGAQRLPFRSRLAVIAAANIYGAIGEKVVTRGARAWDSRTFVPKSEKAWHFVRAIADSAIPARPLSRDGLWTRQI